MRQEENNGQKYVIDENGQRARFGSAHHHHLEMKEWERREARANTSTKYEPGSEIPVFLVIGLILWSFFHPTYSIGKDAVQSLHPILTGLCYLGLALIPAFWAVLAVGNMGIDGPHEWVVKQMKKQFVKQFFIRSFFSLPIFFAVLTAVGYFVNGMEISNNW